MGACSGAMGHDFESAVLAGAERCPASHTDSCAPDLLWNSIWEVGSCKQRSQEDEALIRASLSVGLPAACSQQSNSAESCERCVLCLDALALSEESLGVCTDASGRLRTCQHYFHLSCLRRVETSHCPHCRTRFGQRLVLPDVRSDPVEWTRLVSLEGRESLTQRELLGALQAMFPVATTCIEAVISQSWKSWTEAGEHLSAARVAVCIDVMERAFGRIVPMSVSHVASFFVGIPESVGCCRYQVRSGHHVAGTAPGELCSCGRVHLLRGDRVKRGPALVGHARNGDHGGLGTVLRSDEEGGCVSVTWDRSDTMSPEVYSPHELVHAALTEVAKDTAAVQLETGLSSAAAEGLLRRTRRDVSAAIAIATQVEDCPSSVEFFRTWRVRLFDRVRVLPDLWLVQKWFDEIAPCHCSDANCRGGLQWSGIAGRHLGREAHVVQADVRNDTMLVEFTGRCHCQVWYPRRALDVVWDEGRDRRLRFAVGMRVWCRTAEEWLRGTVRRVWWRQAGWKDRPTVPYRVQLDDGRFLVVPFDEDSLIQSSSGSCDHSVFAR